MTGTVNKIDPEFRFGYPGWKVVLAGFFGVMVSFAAVVPYTFGLYLKPLASTFGWRRESISIAFSIAALTVAVCSPGLGMLLDQYGPRRVILLCIVLFSSAFASLAVLTGHIGFRMGSEGDVTPYLLSRYFGLKYLSTLYALTWTAFAVGGAVGPIILGRVFDVLGSYRPLTIQLLAIPALVPCLLMFLLPRYGEIAQLESKSDNTLTRLSTTDPTI
jgi:MFS family permease